MMVRKWNLIVHRTPSRRVVDASKFGVVENVINGGAAAGRTGIRSNSASLGLHDDWLCLHHCHHGIQIGENIVGNVQVRFKRVFVVGIQLGCIVRLRNQLVVWRKKLHGEIRIDSAIAFVNAGERRAAVRKRSHIRSRN